MAFGPPICLPIETRIGLEPPPVTEMGVYESWCDGFPGPRWTESSVSPGGMELDTDCASFGGGLLFRTAEETLGQGGVIFQSEPLDLSGRKLTVPLHPPETLAWFWFQTDRPDKVNLGSGGQEPTAWFEVAESGGSLVLYMQIDVGEVFENLLIPYDPADHVFLQMRHDKEEGILQLRTAGYCQDWETQVEAPVGSEWQAQRVGFRMDTDSADPLPDFGMLGQVLIEPTIPELEDPEEEEEGNGNGNGNGD
jgi:hypothetical protein